MIKIQNLTKVYDSRAVIDNLSIAIDKGEYVAIVGESGCGKTTLLNIIGLVDTKYLGVYSFEGIKNPRIHSRKGRNLLRNKIGFIFQNYGLIENETVKKNFEIVSKYNSGNYTMTTALEKVGLAGVENKKVFQLSGGEQQRIAIAKLLCKGSEVILADEPTGSLDVKNRDLILDLLQEMNDEGKTIIVVTHDEEVSKRVSKVIKLGGNI